MAESEDLGTYIESLLAEAGVLLVDFSIGKKDRLPCYKLVVYKSSGTGIDDCTRAHRLVQAKLEERFGHDNFYIEVMSPGISWSFQSRRDYTIFQGRGISVELKDGTQVGGILASSNSSMLSITTPQGDQSIAFENIHGCKLDFSREGR